MSADLLAEFGQESVPAQSGPPTTKQPQPRTNALVSDFNQSDDIFFAGTSQSQPGRGQRFSPRSVPGQYVNQAPAAQQVPSFPTFDLPRQNDSDVLFDATEDTPASETDDDWGDFEGPAASDAPAQSNQSAYPKPSIPRSQPSQSSQITGEVDLRDSLSIEDSIPATKKPLGSSGNKPPLQAINPSPTPDPKWDDDSFGDWGGFTDAASNKPTASIQASAPTPKPTPKSPPKKKQAATKPAPPQPTWDDENFDDWGDFNDGPTPAPEPTQAQAQAPTKQKPTSPSPSPGSFTSGGIAPTSTVRPTNIPPPSVLLELLVELMHNLQKEAATASKTHEDRTSQTTTAKKVHTTLSTAARIIAGRTLRWKRDTILSQAMRIGPARAGKSSGMKLSAVNKHEDVKEEQDAVDVLGLWRERAARFNAVVQTAGLRPIPTVPGPAALKVVVAKSGQGALKAPHACALCALKRDERVLRVDEEDVQDSFGEWWTEHWGHTGCRLFWEEFHGMLGQR